MNIFDIILRWKRTFWSRSSWIHEVWRAKTFARFRVNPVIGFTWHFRVLVFVLTALYFRLDRHCFQYVSLLRYVAQGQAKSRDLKYLEQRFPIWWLSYSGDWGYPALLFWVAVMSVLPFLILRVTKWNIYLHIRSLIPRWDGWLYKPTRIYQ